KQTKQATKCGTIRGPVSARTEATRGAALTPPAPGIVTPVLVGHLARGHPDQPGERIVRRPVGGPRGGGGEQRLLHGVLGVGEVAVAPDDRAEGARRQGAQRIRGGPPAGPISGSGALLTARSSMGWRTGAPFAPGAAEILAAISRARSADSTSTIRYPASSSLDSGNGPSVITGALIPSEITVFACSGPASPCASTSSPRSS